MFDVRFCWVHYSRVSNNTALQDIDWTEEQFYCIIWTGNVYNTLQLKFETILYVSTMCFKQFDFKLTLERKAPCERIVSAEELEDANSAITIYVSTSSQHLSLGNKFQKVNWTMWVRTLSSATRQGCAQSILNSIPSSTTFRKHCEFQQNILARSVNMEFSNPHQSQVDGFWKNDVQIILIDSNFKFDEICQSWTHGCSIHILSCIYCLQLRIQCLSSQAAYCQEVLLNRCDKMFNHHQIAKNCKDKDKDCNPKYFRSLRTTRLAYCEAQNILRSHEIQKC